MQKGSMAVVQEAPQIFVVDDQFPQRALANRVLKRFVDSDTQLHLHEDVDQALLKTIVDLATKGVPVLLFLDQNLKEGTSLEWLLTLKSKTENSRNLQIIGMSSNPSDEFVAQVQEALPVPVVDRMAEVAAAFLGLAE